MSYLSLTKKFLKKFLPFPIATLATPQFQGLCSTKSSSETLKNMSYFMYTYKNLKLLLPFFISIYLIFFPKNALRYVAGTFRRAQTLKLGRVLASCVIEQSISGHTKV